MKKRGICDKSEFVWLCPNGKLKMENGKCRKCFALFRYALYNVFRRKTTFIFNFQFSIFNYNNLSGNKPDKLLFTSQLSLLYVLQ